MVIVVNILDVSPGEILAEDIYFQQKLLLKKGTKLTESMISNLLNHQITQISIWRREQQNPMIKQSEFTSPINHLDIMKNDAKVTIEYFLHNIVSDRNVSSSFKELIKNVMCTVIENSNVLESLLFIRANGFFKHSIKTSILSVATGINLELNRDQLIELAVAGLLYDIGECFVDQNIRNKKCEPFSMEERKEMEKHVEYGYKYLKERFPQQISIVAYEHHERVDGTGYPEGIRGNEISLYSKIVSVVDVYAALKSDRPHRQAYPSNEALEYLFASGNRHFDYDVVCAFTKVIAVYTIGNIVLLNNGSYGVILDIKKGLVNRPIIRLLFDSQLQEIEEKKDIDLSHCTTHHILEVIE